MRNMRTLLIAMTLIAGLPAQERAPSADDPVLQALTAELERSFEKLGAAGDAPVHYLAYRLFETETIDLTASYGAIESSSGSPGGRERHLDVALRVGSPERDSTHQIRGEWDFDFDFGDGLGMSSFPIDDDAAAIRTALWLATDAKFKKAQERFAKVKANVAVKVEEEDPSDDFSREQPQVFLGPRVDTQVQRDAWRDRLRSASALYRDYPAVHRSSVNLSATRTRRWIVTSEGTRIRDDRVQYRLFTLASTTADDGMQLNLFDSVEATEPAELPDDATLRAMVTNLAKSLTELRAAPLAEPYVGPAILRPKAAGVFFHEIFGHRIEGHRQKDEEEGRTFAKKVGERIMPELISVKDDPTLERLGGRALNGHYRFDDEGVPAQPVTLVENGTLKSFLMGRSPVRGFPQSNGHGRCSPGNEPVARQGNLIVEASASVPYAKLREMLLEEVRRQGKPYGLVFDEIAGGFTMTQTFMPQAFKLLPLRVYRIWADGRPDELLRGVDLVGTPLASLEKILAASDDVDTFNGTCGAESGWVPVSASSPSLLVTTIEVERQQKAHEKPPILPAPRHDQDPPAGTRR
jgi:predicted Zn-dependent protease